MWRRIEEAKRTVHLVSDFNSRVRKKTRNNNNINKSAMELEEDGLNNYEKKNY